MSYIGIMYKFLYKRSLCSEIPAVTAGISPYTCMRRINTKIPAVLFGCDLRKSHVMKPCDHNLFTGDTGMVVVLCVIIESMLTDVNYSCTYEHITMYNRHHPVATLYQASIPSMIWTED